MASIQQPLSPEALPSPLSSRPERSLCGCLFLEMFFDGAKPRDLQFQRTFRGNVFESGVESPLPVGLIENKACDWGTIPYPYSQRLDCP